MCRTELFPYETCIFYTVVTSLITLERKDLKAKARLPTFAGSLSSIQDPLPGRTH